MLDDPEDAVLLRQGLQEGLEIGELLLPKPHQGIHDAVTRTIVEDPPFSTRMA
ncbi:hypothetical protein K470DRAFT_258731 [Piedraia hortae CBS 480.64]|uniref:Uncharacterized protein n=1 Tax=Piedraia hortae CBS 480.64 TaxID=1314780 RepID=A0A6A7BXV9_9PEZI|nr:hypothetical protein K470DRAFT_258731 [Piedraia hortae CBS 480.64]